jgi:hypothetical protein
MLRMQLTTSLERTRAYMRAAPQLVWERSCDWCAAAPPANDRFLCCAAHTCRASYCCRVCQRLAWHAGHSATCPTPRRLPPVVAAPEPPNGMLVFEWHTDVLAAPPPSPPASPLPPTPPAEHTSPPPPPPPSPPPSPSPPRSYHNSPYELELESDGEVSHLNSASSPVVPASTAGQSHNATEGQYCNSPSALELSSDWDGSPAAMVSTPPNLSTLPAGNSIPGPAGCVSLLAAVHETSSSLPGSGEHGVRFKITNAWLSIMFELDVITKAYDVRTRTHRIATAWHASRAYTHAPPYVYEYLLRAAAKLINPR